MWRATPRRARAGPARRGPARGLPLGVVAVERRERPPTSPPPRSRQPCWRRARVERREGRHGADAPPPPRELRPDAAQVIGRRGRRPRTAAVNRCGGQQPGGVVEIGSMVVCQPASVVSDLVAQEGAHPAPSSPRRTVHLARETGPGRPAGRSAHPDRLGGRQPDMGADARGTRRPLGRRPPRLADAGPPPRSPTGIVHHATVLQTTGASYRLAGCEAETRRRHPARREPVDASGSCSSNAQRRRSPRVDDPRCRANQHDRVLAGVKARRYAPPPLRGAAGQKHSSARRAAGATVAGRDSHPLRNGAPFTAHHHGLLETRVVRQTTLFMARTTGRRSFILTNPYLQRRPFLQLGAR